MIRLSKAYRVIIIVTLLFLVGCGDQNNTVQTCIIANDSYTTKTTIEEAVQPEILKTETAVYASIQFIESPKGMEYTVKWYLDDEEVKKETKATVNDKRDILIYTLDGEQAVAGEWKLEILYKETVLVSKVFKIQ